MLKNLILPWRLRSSSGNDLVEHVLTATALPAPRAIAELE
jgi:hypothetical protein